MGLLYLYIYICMLSTAFVCCCKVCDKTHGVYNVKFLYSTVVETSKLLTKEKRENGF
jgi:hypothetical protein